MIFKKILFILIFFFLFSNISYWYNIPITVTLKNLTLPIDNKWIDITYNRETRKLLTNENGEVNLIIDYRENDFEWNKIVWRIDWNYFSLSKYTNKIKNIEINYDSNKKEIIEILNVDWDLFIDNQKIIKNSNYKLLSIYILFTVFIITIFWGGRIIYNLLWDDIFKHKV